MNILSTHNLTKIYGNGDNAVHALSHVSLDIEEGTFVSIIGSSGSGKSTLLNLLGGLDRPTSGEVIVDGKSSLPFLEDGRSDLYFRITI